MENIPVFGQTSQLLASAVVLLALGLGIIFYSWSFQLFKRIEILITKMRKNIDSLENLSQSIYESAYLEIKKGERKNHQNDKRVIYASEKEGVLLNEINEQIRQLVEKQNEIALKLEQKAKKESEEQKEFASNPKQSGFSRAGEQGQYQEISELIIRYLRDLLKEKEQVTAQELVYAMPKQYSLADIYRTLEEMKEKNQIHWEERIISPHSILKMN